MAKLAFGIIPSEILRAFYPDSITIQTLIEGGEINTTLLITDNEGQKTILQRLSPIYDARLAEDYEIVSAHLKALGWEMATTLKASNGAAYVPDPDNVKQLWRSFSYIESEPGSEREGDWEASIALGNILGKLHRSLATLDYQPKFSLPHFSDNQVYVDHLMRIMPEIKEATDCQLAKDLISASKGYRVTDTPTQLIHGDSRIGNVLFRHEKPLTFIDWDGLSIANPLLDVGDMLQSIVSELKPEDMTRFSIVQLSPVIEAYLHGAELTRNKAVFIRDALAAAQLLALGLGMRHLIDSVEDSYFTPPNKVESRYIFNIRRANEQRDVYRMLRM